MAAMQEAIEGLRAVGAVRAIQQLESELAKHKRRERELVRESPAVADAFLQRRKAETQEQLRKRHLAAEHNDREVVTKKVRGERDTAIADLKRHKKAIQDYENLQETRHAMKTFTVESLGQGSSTAGGAQGRKRRSEVLDRMSRLGSGFSPGQKNDFGWFKDSWDLAMVAQHKSLWGGMFAAWMQGVLVDEGSNAFSVFVYNESCRVFHGAAALHVP